MHEKSEDTMRTTYPGIFTLSTLTRTRGVVSALLLSSVLWATDGWAQVNLLSNPDFVVAVGLTNWTAFGGANGTQIHEPDEDVGNVAASGAADLSLNAATAAGDQSGISQCVVVAPTTNYNYGTRVKVPMGQTPGTVFMFVEVEFFSGAGCLAANTLGGEGQGGTIGAIDYPLSNTVWYGIPGTVPGTAQTVMSPVGAGSAVVRLYLERNGGTTTATAFFDNPFLGIGVIPVELQEFVVE